MSEFRVCLSSSAMVEELAKIQRLCFPTVGKDELITAAQYRHHIQVFPEGQLVVVTPDGEVVASSTSCRRRIDFAHYHHTYMEASGQNWLHSHDPSGDWLYGVDIGVHPSYRGRGLSRLLYDARKALVEQLGLRGMLVGGMLKGFASYRATMSAEAYLSEVKAGRIFDPTVSVQLRQGFQVHGLMPNHIDDPTIDGAAALLVWRRDSAKRI
jgi:GNAT superfamily N-acetyltransferase